MPVFSYEAIIERGTRASGRVEAAHREDAARQLASKGLHVVRLREVNPTIWTKEIEIGRRRVKQEDFVSFCRQFATLVRAGIPLVESLQALTEQTRNKQLASALLDVTDRVVEGQVLSDSFAVHPRVFPNLFVQMIHAGEVSGTLDEVLDSVASYTEKQHETIEKVKSAMMYPISVSVSAIAVAIFLLVRVVPTFVNVFQNQHLVLPLPTRILLAISFFITHRWYFVLAIAVVLGALVTWMYRQPKTLYQKDRYMLRLPVFGSLLHKNALAQTTRTMALLFHSAVPALQAMTITADVTSNRYIQRALIDARERLASGESIVDPLRESEAFPPMVTQMIRVGEQTGNLDEMLARVADFYERDVAAIVDRLRQLIEPVMIVVLAVVVGGIVLSALLPMFSLYQGLDS